jgi:hypothetical protein
MLFFRLCDEERHEGKQRCNNCHKLSVGDIDIAAHHITRGQDDDSNDIYADEEGLHASVAARYVEELDYPRQSNETESSEH